MKRDIEGGREIKLEDEREQEGGREDRVMQRINNVG